MNANAFNFCSDSGNLGNLLTLNLLHSFWHNTRINYQEQVGDFLNSGGVCVCVCVCARARTCVPVVLEYFRNYEVA